MASSILRWISGNSPKFSLLRGLMDPVNNSPKFSLLRGLMDPAKSSPKLSLLRGLMEPATSSKTSSPWLMIPPTFEGNNNKIMVFNFYSFQDNALKKFFCERVGILASNDIKFVSSSHGWLALFNPGKCDLVLFNPVSDRQIKLPPFHTLDIDRVVFRRRVTKVITSCSPEEEECRIMLSFGLGKRLAFCSPSSAEWTPIGDLHLKGQIFKPIPRFYKDFVYSSTQKRFYCITSDEQFEAWDLEDTRSPKILELDPNKYRKHASRGRTFLVAAEESDELFWVRRYIMQHMNTDGSEAHHPCESISKLPYKTTGFDVYKYDPEKDALVYMDGSLDGLAFFIGNNHSFTISASKYPELKPNSIYFTDAQKTIREDFYRPDEELEPFGGHDIGIFDYENKSFSPTCYYPCDRQNIKRIMPAPMWFTPKY